MRALTILAGVVLLAAGRLHAGEAVSTPLERFDDPDAKSGATATASRLVLEAGDADAKATLRVANRFSNANQDLHSRFSLTITAPFDSKKADKVDVGTLSGLTAGTSAAFEFGLARWNRPNYDDAKLLTEDCRKWIGRLLPRYDWDTVGRVSLLNCGDDFLSIEKIDKAADEINAERKKCQKLAAEDFKDADKEQKATCRQLEGKPDAARAPDAERVIASIRGTIMDKVLCIERPMHTLSFGVKASTQDYKYVLATAPAADPSTSQKTGIGFSLAYTYVGDWNLFTAGLSHEESYKAGTKVEVCNPIGTTGSLSCSEAVIGAPSKKTAELGFLELRRILYASRLAITPRIEYDFEESEWAARVPIYFVANKKRELTAGVTLGYTEADDEGFGATVFVSKAFTFFD